MNSLHKIKSTQTMLRAVSIIEATKGAIVLLSGFGALSFLHHNIQSLAENVISRLHLNPAKHYPRIFLDAAAHLTDKHLIFFAVLAMAYATVRIAEAYGLWYERRWAEWIAAISGGVYIPFELYELYKNPSILIFLLLTTNILIVVIMLNALIRKPS